MPDEVHAIFEALLYSNTTQMKEESFFLFSKLGLAHALSASGLHMSACLIFSHSLIQGMYCTLLYFIPHPSAREYLSRSKSLWVSLGTLFFSASLAHLCSWQKPMVRAFLFSALLLSAKIFHLKTSRRWIVAWSLLACCFLGTGSLLSTLLSCTAFLAIVLAIEISEKKNTGIQILWLTLAPYLSTLPIILYHFALFSPLSPLINALFCPLLSIGVLFPGFLFIVEKFIFGTKYFQDLAEFFLGKIIFLMQHIDQNINPIFWVEWKRFLVFFIFFLPLIFYKREKRKIFYVYITIILIGISLEYKTFSRAIILDVGQGDSIFLQGKKSLLVDFGPPTKAPYAAKASIALEKHGIDQIDDLLLTHPDQDHYGGIHSLLYRHKIKNALWVHPESLFFGKIEKILLDTEAAAIPIRFLKNGENINNQMNCALLYGEKNSNALSPLCNYSLDSGKNLLLTGDMNSAAENYFSENHPELLKANFLKVAHHGSKSSSSENFLLATGAKSAFISVGKKNRYHHPTHAALKRLQNFGMKIHRTDQEGHLYLE